MSPKLRQSLYAIGGVATGFLTLLSLWKVIDPATASTLNASLTGLLSLLGAGAAGTAAVITGKQRKDGVLADPATQVANGWKAVQDQVAAAKAQADAVKAVIASSLEEAPALGPLAQQVLDQLKK